MPREPAACIDDVAYFPEILSPIIAHLVCITDPPLAAAIPRRAWKNTCNSLATTTIQPPVSVAGSVLNQLDELSRMPTEDAEGPGDAHR